MQVQQWKWTIVVLFRIFIYINVLVYVLRAWVSRGKRFCVEMWTTTPTIIAPRLSPSCDQRRWALTILWRRVVARKLPIYAIQCRWYCCPNRKLRQAGDHQLWIPASFFTGHGVLSGEAGRRVYDDTSSYISPRIIMFFLCSSSVKSASLSLAGKGSDAQSLWIITTSLFEVYGRHLSCPVPCI